MSVRVTGGDELTAMAERFRRAGRTDLVRELGQEIKRDAQPLPGVARQGALAVLPKAGGLAADVAGATFGLEVRTSGRQVTVSVVAVSGMDIRRMDAGRVRHPRYGNRDKWYTQHVTPGWFTRTLLTRAPQFRASAERALKRVADKF